MLIRSNAGLAAVLIMTLCVALSMLSGCGETQAVKSPTLPPPDSPAQMEQPKSGAVAPYVPPPIQQESLQKEIPLDVVKYPQDTPEHAVESLAKALENDDLGYQIAWLATPDFTYRMIDKYKTIAAAVAANQDPVKVAGRKQVLDAVKKAQAKKDVSHGKVNGTPFFLFALDDSKFLQFEQQPDKRWCWNSRIRTSK